MHNCPIRVLFMAAPSLMIQEIQRMLKDQNAKDLTQYIKKRNSLERTLSHHCNLVAFLDMKAIARNNQDSDHRGGNQISCYEHKIIVPQSCHQFITHSRRQSCLSVLVTIKWTKIALS